MPSTVQLYGSPLSNYYNKVKIALIELAIPYEERAFRPGNDFWPESGSPSGKIPFLQTQDGGVYESQVIVEYLEDISAGPTLFPQSPIERAHCRELIQYLELYLDAPARTIYPAAYFGKELDEALLQTALQNIAKGLQLLARRAQFNPWLCGAQFTHADVAAWVHINTIEKALARLSHKGYVFEQLPALTDYIARLSERPSIRQAEADRIEASRRLATA